jgi:hypothetical protein
MTVGQGQPTSPDRSVDAAFAEFAALRAELLAHSANQNTLVGFGITSVGVVLGLAVGGSGNLHVLFIVPILTSFVVLAYCGETYRVIAIGRYIRVQLWPFIQLRAHDELPSWEAFLDARRRMERRLAGIVELPLVALLYLVGLASAIFATGVPLVVNILEVLVVNASTVIGFLLSRRGTMVQSTPGSIRRLR